MSQLHHLPFSLGRVTVAYCSSVTVAAGLFTLKVGPGFGAFLISWVSAFVLSLLPYAGAIVVARRFSIRSWWYFIGGAVATAAVICIPFASAAREGPPLGPVPDTIPSLFESYLQIFPSYWLSGLVAGVVSWLYFRRWEGIADAQPCGQTDLAHKAAQGRLP